MTNKQRYN